MFRQVSEFSGEQPPRRRRCDIIFRPVSSSSEFRGFDSIFSLRFENLEVVRGCSCCSLASTSMGEPSSRSRGGQSDTHSLRCPHCAGPLSKEMETSEWTVSPLIRDSFSMIGSAVGGTAGAFYGFNHAMPIVRRGIKGPMWLHFLIGAPPVIVFSSGCAGLAGGSIPALVQLASSSYHAAVSSSPSQPRSSS